jgi:hypothetical protein
MQKVLLVSILVLMIALPAAAAGELRARLALRRAVWWMVTGIVWYVLAVRFVYPRLVG